MTQAEKRYWKNWEIKMEQVKEDAHELMVMRHEAVTRYQEGMDKHDVIDPMASDVIY